jgi:hypothetical protein
MFDSTTAKYLLSGTCARYWPHAEVCHGVGHGTCAATDVHSCQSATALAITSIGLYGALPHSIALQLRDGTCCLLDSCQPNSVIASTNPSSVHLEAWQPSRRKSLSCLMRNTMCFAAPQMRSVSLWGMQKTKQKMRSIDMWHRRPSHHGSMVSRRCCSRAYNNDSTRSVCNSVGLPPESAMHCCRSNRWKHAHCRISLDPTTKRPVHQHVG